MEAGDLIFQQGFPERFRSSAAKLYEEAFGEKLSVAVRSDQARLSLLEDIVVPEFSIVSLTNNELVGIAGFQTPQGSFTGGFLSGGAAFNSLTSKLGVVNNLPSFQAFREQLKASGPEIPPKGKDLYLIDSSFEIF